MKGADERTSLTSAGGKGSRTGWFRSAESSEGERGGYEWSVAIIGVRMLIGNCKTTLLIGLDSCR